MSDPITLILLVAAGEAASAQTKAMARATHDALGGAPVETVETHDPTSDDDALAVERGAHAAAVVEVAWTDPGRRRVSLRVHLAKSRRWIERSFGFAATDAPSEQGRTMGFAVASMFPDAPEQPASPSAGRTVRADAGPETPANASPLAPPPTVQPSKPGATDSATRIAPAAPGAAPAPDGVPGATAEAATAPGVVPDASAREPATPLTNPPSESVPSERARPGTSAETGEGVPPEAGPGTGVDAGPGVRAVMIDLIALVATGDAGGLGAAGAVAWWPLPAVAIRLGGGARSSNVDVAQASALTVFGSVGAVLAPWRATHARPIEAWLRLDYVVSRLSLTHFDGDAPSPVTQARWLSGVSAVLDVGWFFAATAELFAGGGIQSDFGTTEVYDDGSRVATLPSLRAVAEAGVRIRF